MRENFSFDVTFDASGGCFMLCKVLVRALKED